MTPFHVLRSKSPAFGSAAARLVLGGIFLLLSACGGGGGGGPPPPGTPPTITLQPVDVTVTAGAAASFTIAATGDAPLAVQWQRDGVDIAGAAATTYALASTALGDSGAAFRAVVTNATGSATSDAARLTVTVAPPVLTITLQPANTSVVAGTSATFTVAATCSTGALAVQWQRNTGGTWAAIAGANAATYSLATALGDNGAQFRTALDCGGLSTTVSTAALLTVTSPLTVTLAPLPVVGLQPQAEILIVAGIDQEAAGSYTFISSNRVKRLSADLSSIRPVAGGNGLGSTDGAGDTALFFQPLSLTHDAAGNVYVADSGNFTIRRIAPDGTVSTLAGQAGIAGNADGAGSAARFTHVTGIAIGPDGDLYVADYDNARVRRVTTAGVVTTYAGSVFGVADGAPSTARFVGPSAIAVAANGDVLVADGSRIRRVVRSGNAAGSVETVAGSSATDVSGADGVGAAAIVSPTAMVVRGNVLTFRDARGLLRQLDLTTAAVTTLAGSRTLGEGFVDGIAPNARVTGTGGLTLAPGGGFMLAENRAIRQASATGLLHTIASGFAKGMTTTGTGVLAQMPFAGLASERLQAVTVDPAGNVVVVEKQSRLVRRISPAGVVTLAAGLTTGPAPAEMIDGVGSAAQFVSDVASIASDSTGVLYVGDSFGVRRIALDNTTTLLAGSRTASGAVDGSAGSARFGAIWGLAVKPGGDVFVGDSNNAVRRVNAAGSVSTYAGVMGQSGIGDGAIATARFTEPRQVAFAPDGSLYVVDVQAFDGTVRKVSSDGMSVSSLPIPANSDVTAVAVDAAGTLYYGSNTHGLMRLPPGGTPSVVIPHGAYVVLGASPTLWNIDGIAVLGPQQLVVLSSGQILKVTLP